MTDLETLTDEQLMARRCEVAEAINPLLLKLEAIDDVLMHRRRAAQRARIIAGPVHCETENPTEVV